MKISKFVLAILFVSMIGLASCSKKKHCNSCPDWGKVEQGVDEHV